MSSLKLDFDAFKSAGVYTLEYDNTAQEINEADSFRLAVGFTEHGPFNRPVYLNGQSDRRKLFGSKINTKLEKRGSFFDRSLDVLLGVEPTIALNLLNVDEKDVVGMKTFGLAPNYEVDGSLKENHIKNNVAYSEFFDKSKFWIPSSDNLRNVAIAKTGVDFQKEAHRGPLFSVVNLGTEDITVFVLKDTNVVGYNVNAFDWYGGEIPYKWIQPTDYIADYFVRVIALKGNWSDTALLSTDKTWSEFFDENGLKVDKLAKFISNENVSLIGNWSGAIIPNCYNKAGKLVSIEPLVNNSTAQTGVLISFNEFAMESLINDSSTHNQYYDDNLNDELDENENEEAKYKIDMVGHFINGDAVSLLSYKSANVSDIVNEVIVNEVNGNSFTVVPSSNDPYLTSIQLGTLVKGSNGFLTKIIKKAYKDNVYEFTCNGAVDVNDNDKLEIYEASAYKLGDREITAKNKTLGEVFVDSSKYNAKFIVYHVNEDGKAQCIEIVGDEVKIEVDSILAQSAAYTTAEYKDAKYILTSAPVKDEKSILKVELHKQLTEVFTRIEPTCLKGLKITNKHRPGFDKDGNANVEAGVEKIYSMLEDEGIRRGLKNKDMVSFRYLIDTMDGGIGIELGGKKHLAKLAKEVGQCTALINFPSVSLLKLSTDPIFCDSSYGNAISKPFSTKYIPTGGNTDYYISEPLSMPIKDNGADYAATFSPFLKYATGSQTILMPPAAHVANTFMVKYNGGDPYATIANTNGYLNDGAIVGLEMMYDVEDRDALEPFGVNPIIPQSGRFTIYGNRTCYQEMLSDLNYLHVRELLNKLELESIEVLKPFTFRTNNAVVRAECVRSLEPIYEAALLSGALYSYNIIMDESNNTEDVISRAFGVVDVEVQVNKNMEKIVQRITLEKISQ
jgi:hypothetical protein